MYKRQLASLRARWSQTQVPISTTTIYTFVYTYVSVLLVCRNAKPLRGSGVRSVLCKGWGSLRRDPNRGDTLSTVRSQTPTAMPHRRTPPPIARALSVIPRTPDRLSSPWCKGRFPTALSRSFARPSTSRRPGCFTHWRRPRRLPFSATEGVFAELWSR